MDALAVEGGQGRPGTAVQGVAALAQGTGDAWGHGMDCPAVVHVSKGPPLEGPPRTLRRGA